MEFGEGFDDELNVLLARPCDVHFNDDFTTDVLSLVHLCIRRACLLFHLIERHTGKRRFMRLVN